MSSDAFDPEQPAATAAGRRLAGADRGAASRRRKRAPAGAERTANSLPDLRDLRAAARRSARRRWSRSQTALAEDPTSGRVIQEMERLARGHGIWGELAAVTAEVADGLEDPKQAADLWVQIAFWNETGRAHARRGGQGGRDGADAGARARRRAGAARESLSPTAQLGSLRRDPRRVGAIARAPIPPSSPTATARCCATSRGTPARSTVWRACTRRRATGIAAAETLRRLVAALPEGRSGSRRSTGWRSCSRSGSAIRAAPRSSWRWLLALPER